VGIEELKGFRAALAIYPNPFSDRILVDLRNTNNPAGITVKLYNVLGQEIDCEVSRMDSVIHMASGHLPSGIYFIRVYEKGELLAKEKLIRR
jgi:hypothetical protein